MQRVRAFVSKVVGIASVLALLLGAAGCNTVAPAAKPAESYPTQPIKFVIAGGAGDAFDTVGRKITPTFGQKLGAEVQPVNITGPQYIDFFEEINRAKGDGYTLGLVPSSNLLYFQMKSGLLKFDPGSLPGVIVIETLPDVVFASAKSEIKTAKDLLTTKKPVRIASYASFLVGVTSMAIVAKERSITLQPVTYAVFPDAHTGVLRGDVDIITGTGSGTTLKFVASGDYIPLFVWGKERYSALPNVPSSEELGLTPALSGTKLYRVFVVPPATPQDRIEKLAAALRAVFTDSAIVAWGKEAQQPLTTITAEQFKKEHAALLSIYSQNADTLKPLIK